MSQEDDDAPERPAGPNTPPAAPRPKPPVPRAPPPPGPPPESNPFLTRESTRDIDVGWLAPESVPEVPVAPAKLDAPPSDPRVPAGAAPPEQAPVAPGEAKAAPPESADDSASTPASPAPSAPSKTRSRARVLAFALVAALVLVGGGFVYQSQVTARSSKQERGAPQPSAETIVEPPPPATVPPPPPTHTVEPPPSASAEKKKPAAGAGGAGAPTNAKADPASQGILDTMQLPPGRKIIVDGRVVGTSPRRVAVRCGTHRIQVGDLPPESIELPCGGEVSFTE
jgi:hypothetical protein